MMRVAEVERAESESYRNRNAPLKIVLLRYVKNFVVFLGMMIMRKLIEVVVNWHL